MNISKHGARAPKSSPRQRARVGRTETIAKRIVDAIKAHGPMTRSQVLQMVLGSSVHPDERDQAIAELLKSRVLKLAEERTQMRVYQVLALRKERKEERP